MLQALHEQVHAFQAVDLPTAPRLFVCMQTLDLQAASAALRQLQTLPEHLLTSDVCCLGTALEGLQSPADADIELSTLLNRCQEQLDKLQGAQVAAKGSPLPCKQLRVHASECGKLRNGLSLAVASVKYWAALGGGEVCC